MADAVERWRANRAALAELELDPRELARRLELSEHEAAEIAAARLAARRGRGDPRRGSRPPSTARRSPAARRRSTTRSPARRAAPASALAVAAPRGARARPARSAVRAARRAARRPRGGGRGRRVGGPRAAEAVDHDPAELARLEERLSTIYALERRYGDDEAAVIAHGERAAAEAERLRGLDGERARRARRRTRGSWSEVAAAGARAVGRCGRRRPRRSPTAVGDGPRGARLPAPACSRSSSAGDRPARDEPAVEIDGDAVAFDATGIDEVVFRLAPNPGEPPRPLAQDRVGRRAEPRRPRDQAGPRRRPTTTPTLVFDEVDTGIGGRSADPVGRSLWTLARRHQVLCVTHLPQIAAHADAHFQIAKRERDGRTVTEVGALDREGRIVELAQMLGGASAAARPRSPPPASCSTGPRPGVAGARAGLSARPRGRRRRAAAADDASIGRSTTT